MSGSEKVVKNKVAYLSKWLDKEFKEEDVGADGDEICANSIELEIMIECLQFLHDQGLMENGMEQFMKFFYQLFNDTVRKALAIEYAVDVIRQRVIGFFSNGKYTALFVKSVIDYLSSSILQHYHLMLYVMNTPRSEELNTLMEDVEMPPLTEPLCSGVPFTVWELEGKIIEKDLIFKDREKELHNRFADITEKLREEINEYLSKLKGPPLNSSDVYNITSTILQKYSLLTNTELELLIEASEQVIMLKVEKSRLLAGVGTD